MWSNSVASACALAAGTLILSLQMTASAGLSIVWQQAAVNAAKQDVVFSLEFNQPPDLTSVDSLGRREDSFQYEIVPNTTTPIDQMPFSAIRAVVRGDEMTAGSLPVRNGNMDGSDPNPKAGGWGAVRGTVPFTLTDDTLKFIAPFNLIGTTSGVFSYRVFTTNFGSTVSSVESVSVPLPPALPAAGATVVAVAGLGLLRRRVIKAL